MNNSTTVPRLSSLPVELQSQIVSHVYDDYGASLYLSLTNKHFNSLVDLKRVDQASRISYLQRLQFSPDHLFKDFACFACLRLKPRFLFDGREARRRKYLGRRDELTRRCLGCVREDRRVQTGVDVDVDIDIDTDRSNPSVADVYSVSEHS